MSRALDLVSGSCEQGEADAFKRVVGHLIAEIDTHALVLIYRHYIDLAPPKLRESLASVHLDASRALREFRQQSGG